MSGEKYCDFDFDDDDYYSTKNNNIGIVENYTSMTTTSATNSNEW